MEKNKRELILSIFVKSLIVVGAIIGIYYSIKNSGFSHFFVLLYYTLQSNIEIALICIVFIVYDIIALKKNGEEKIPNWLRIVKFVFVVAITLTGLIFNFLLLPVSLGSEFPMNPFELGNFFTHIFVPVVSIVDFVLFDYKLKSKKCTFLWGLATADLYFVFAMICSAFKVDFHSGYHNVPYFFMDYVNNGLFKFNLKEMQIGLVYGGIIINALLVGLCYLLMFIKNKRASKKIGTTKERINEKKI